MPTPPDRDVRLEPARRRWLTKQVKDGKFESVSEALNFCVAEAARIAAARAELDRAIAEGDKGPFTVMDDKWRADFLREVAAQRKARARRKSA